MKPKTIRIKGHSNSHEWASAQLAGLTARELTEHLRARKVPIPKGKPAMVERLANQIARDGFHYELTIR